MSRGVLRRRNSVLALLGALVCGVLAWRLWLQAGLAATVSTGTPLLGLPVAPVVYFMSVASAVCTLILLAQVVAPDDSPTFDAGKAGGGL